MLINEFPDVVAFTESWLDQSTPDSLLVDNNAYSVFRKDRFNEPYGGVCLLLNNATIKAVRVDIADNFNDIDILSVDVLKLLLQPFLRTLTVPILPITGLFHLHAQHVK